MVVVLTSREYEPMTQAFTRHVSYVDDLNTDDSLKGVKVREVTSGVGG
jgi:hypothetical protein